MFSVTHINTLYDKGGAAVIANNIHNQLLNEKHKSVYIYGYNRGKKVKDPFTVQINLRPLIKYNYFLYYYFMKQPYYFKNRLKFSLSRGTIIHLHNLHSFYLNPADLVSILKTRNNPVIWTLHDEWILTGRCAFTYGCDGYKSKCINCPNSLYYPPSKYPGTQNSYFEKGKMIGSIKDQLQIVTQSHFLKEKVEKSPFGELIQHDIKVIPNGIDKILFKNQKPKYEKLQQMNLDITQESVLFVADYLDYRKGFDLYIELAKIYPDYQFIAVGRYVGLKDDLLPPNIRLTGRVSQMTLVDLYNFAKGFLFLSRADNYPTTILESIACGCPVLALNVGAIQEMIPQKSGIICSCFENIKTSFLDFMLRTWDVDTDFVSSTKQMVNEYIQLYKRINNDF